MPVVKAKAKEKKTVKTTAKKAVRKVTIDDVWAIIADIGKAHKKLEKAQQEMQKALKETQQEMREALKETQMTEISHWVPFDDYGRRFSDIVERTLIPALANKFDEWGFDCTGLAGLSQ